MLIADCGFRDSSFNSGAERLVHEGPTLLVDIGFDPKYKYAASGSTFNSGITQVPALVDTGATFSCIDDALAQSLNLPLVDRQMVWLVGGKRELNAYLAHVMVPALSFFQHGIFYGIPFTEIGRSYRALIGRTFLRGMVLVYDGRTGAVRIIRQPSGNDVAPQQAKGGSAGVTRC